MSIVLASASAARRRLLEAAGVAVVTDAADIDEGLHKARFQAEGRSAEDCVLALAEEKAAAVASRHHDAFVIGADQILVCGSRWFDKPRDRDEARAQLMLLRGRGHELVSAVAIVRGAAILWRHAERARLVMRAFSDAFLGRYLESMGARVCRSVGAYEIEGPGAQLFAGVEGDYFAIQGLPLVPLLEALRAEGALLP